MMKAQLKIALVGMLMSIGVIATANQISVENVSKGGKPITVEFQRVYLNPGKVAEIQAGGTLQLGKSVVDVSLKGYQKVGIAVTAVNGKKIPGEISETSHKGCVIMTDASKSNAMLQIDLEMFPNHHGKISCKMS